MEAEKKQEPVFVMGSGRSGTSILTAALKSGADIPGFNEGHFLPLVSGLMREVGRHFRNKEALLGDGRHMIAHIDRAELEEELVALIKAQCEALQPEGLWLDKSPTADMILAVPYLRKAWPEARYVFAKRRGIENVISRMKKFPHVDFETHCRQWSQCMDAWLSVREEIDDCSIEVEQRDIALHPAETAVKIGRFLRLDAGKVDRMANVFSKTRPQSTGSQEQEAALDITDSGWTERQKAIFRKHCRKVSDAFGYSEGPEYHL